MRIDWSVSVALLLGFLPACTGGVSHTANERSALSGEGPFQFDDGWTVVPAIEAGLDPCILGSMGDAIRQGADFRGVHAVLIAKGESLVYESYFNGEDRRRRGGELQTVSIAFHPDTLHDLRSVGKLSLIHI